MKRIIKTCFILTFLLVISGCQFVPITPGGGTEVESNILVDIPSYMSAGKEYLIEASTKGVDEDTYEYSVDNKEIVEIVDNKIITKFAGTFELTIKSNSLNEELTLSIEIKDTRTFKITYVLSGGELIDPISTFTASDVVELPIPTKESYIFGGWYLDENLLGNPISEIDGKTVMDYKVYAKWIFDDGKTDECEAVENMIRELPLVISIKNKEEVETVRSAFDKLPKDQQDLITNYQKLLNAEAKIKIEVAKFQTVIDLIDLIPEEISLNESGLIIDAEKAYEKLGNLYKPYVTNYQKLLDARKALNELLDQVDFNIHDYIPEFINDEVYVPSSIGSKTLKWSIVDSSLLYVSGETLKINKVYQNHQEQKVTIRVVLNDGVNEITVDKQTTVGPIVYDEFTSSPVAAYVNSGAMSHYIKYNGRDEVFSDKSKELLDIVYYCFVNPASNGGVTITDTFLKYYDDVIALKNSGVRVVVSVAGSTQIFSDVCNSDTLREKFAEALVKVVLDYNFDGIDLDWEYPGTGSRDTAIDKANYTKLFKSLRQKLDAIQDPNGSNYLLTSAVPATSWGTNRYDFPGMNTYLDYVNMMSYDLNRTDKTTHISGLYTSNSDGGYGFSVEYGVNRFTSLGLDKSKIIIGSATYGKAYKVTGAVSSSSKYPGLNTTGKLTIIDGVTGSHASGTIYYYGIQELIKTGKYTKYIDKLSNGNICGSYLYNEAEKIFISYESAEVIAAKYNYAVKNGVGIMCWSMPEDASDVYINTIYDIRYGK